MQKIKKSRLSKKVRKNSHILFQTGLLIAVGVLFFNNKSPQKVSQQQSFVANIDQPLSLDEVTSAEIASAIAKKTNISLASNVTNLADTIRVRDSLGTVETAQFIDIPQIIQTDEKTVDDIIKYVVKEDDTVNSIAQKFNITSDTIIAANDLLTNTTEVEVDKELIILPINGILHTIEDGDTAASLAQEYSANAAKITAFNDAEEIGLVKGQQVIVPDGKIFKALPVVQQITVASGPVIQPVINGNQAPVSGTLPAAYYQPCNVQNGYACGNCTWWAAERRKQIGKPIPSNLGNAATWANIAASVGYQVDNVPQVGDVVWYSNIWANGGYGHVSFVEEVRADGSVLISDMNWYENGGGYSRVSFRILSPAAQGAYSFIH